MPSPTWGKNDKKPPATIFLVPERRQGLMQQLWLGGPVLHQQCQCREVAGVALAVACSEQQPITTAETGQKEWQ